jgi:LmbE family N-acetylglucosaminyl deacetylase
MIFSHVGRHFWLLGILFASFPLFGASIPLLSTEELAAMPELKSSYPDLPQDPDGDIFLIFAHADDELTILGQIAWIHEHEPTRPIHWILVSDSGKGHTLPWKCGDLSKVECRASEAKASADCAGIEHPRFLGFPDGGLPQVADLKTPIAAAIDDLRQGRPVAAVYTHDDTGLYGHPDHLAVHDAVLPIAQERHIPFVTIALPELFKSKIDLSTTAAKNRVQPPITQKLDLDADLQTKLVCATNAHASQGILLWTMMGGHSAETFYSVVPRQFFNLSGN